MKENFLFKNKKTQDIQMMTDFKDELERIKQKLAKDYAKYSELEKMKNKQKLSGKALIYKKKEENNEDDELYIKEIKNNDNNNYNYNKTIPSTNSLNFNYDLQSNIKQMNLGNKNTKDSNKLKESDENIEKDKNNYQNNDINQYKTRINYLPSINTHNINPLNYNISFRKKYIDMPNEEDDLNFSFTNDLNKNKTLDQTNNQSFDYFSKNLDSTKIINNNINININNNSSLILDSKLEKQIKFIDEKSEDNRLEEEKTQKKIKQIEKNLQLEERLTHNNREIRKNAIKEMIEMCQRDFEKSQDKQKMFEFFSPWIKYCLGETNSYVIPESLNFFIIFNKYFPGFLAVSMKDFFDNVERFISFGVYGINEHCIKIFLMMFEDKKLYSQTFNEFMKLLIKSSSIKVYKFIQELIIALLNKNLLQENYIKLLFERIITIYSTINKNNDKKRIFSQLIKNIYYYIEDDYDDIKQNIKLSSYKELDSLFEEINSSENKKSFITYTLYPRPILTEIDNSNNNHNFFNFNSDLNDRIKTEKSFDNYKSLYEKRRENKTFEKRNIGGTINSKGGVNDLLSVLPNEFLEYHFEVQFQAKIQILEKTNELLNMIKYVKDKEKNIIDIYKIINISISDSNILIHLEGIKLLENICRLINNYINKQKLKLLLESCFDKLKDKKSIVKNELFKLFNTIIEYNCLELSKFISFILNYCLNEKNDNIKLGLLEYIKTIFSEENLKLIKNLENMTEKEFLFYSKKLVNIIEKESLSLIKDLCTDLLIIMKRKIISSKAFQNIICNLPNYRIKLIQNEEQSELNDSIYKRTFKQKKSSYSSSNIKKNYFRNNRTLSNVSSTNSSFIKDRISSNNPVNIKRFKKINLYSNKNPRNKIMKNLNKHYSLNDKTNISFNNSPRLRKIFKDDNDNKYINKTEINEDDNFVNNKKNKTSGLTINNNESLDIQKNNLIKSINNINEDAIEKYSIVIIKDFISFIKKVSIQKNEDLSRHFELIFVIYEKIFQRILYLMGKNKNVKQSIINLKKLMDELMNYISKILILTPSIHQIKGTTKFDMEKLEKYLSIFKNFCFSPEKYYMTLLLNLFKFCNGNDEDFPKLFNSNNSAIYFLNYIKKENKKLNSKKILNILKEFIAETNSLTIEEKNELLEDVELNNNIDFGKELKLNDDIKIAKKEKNVKEDNSFEESSSDENLTEKKYDIKLKEGEKFKTKLKSYDFTAIEESIKLFSNSLKKLPIKSIKNKIQQNKTDKIDNNSKYKNNSLNIDNKIIDNNEIKKNMSALNIPYSVLKNKLTLNNTKNLSLKLPSKKQLNQSFDKLNKEENNLDSKILKTEINENTYRNKKMLYEKKENNNYNEILNNILKILNNEIANENIFNSSLLLFFKLSSSQKLDFIKALQNNIKQKDLLLENTSINILLNFYDFILSILSFQILKFPQEESIIVAIQNFIQIILNYRNIDDMFKIMFFLLKKYFPKDLNKKLEDINIVMIKIISYFLKELLKKIKIQKINGKNIIYEINDLFVNTPPSSLTTKTPNCILYQNIFTLLKSITDEIAFQNKETFNDIILYLQEKHINCEEYVLYLIKLSKTLNK